MQILSESVCQCALALRSFTHTYTAEHVIIQNDHKPLENDPGKTHPCCPTPTSMHASPHAEVQLNNSVQAR